MNGVVEIIPEADLPAAVALRRAHREHAILAIGPVVALEVHECDLAGGIAERVALDGAPAFRGPSGKRPQQLEAIPKAEFLGALETTHAPKHSGDLVDGP